MTDKKIGIVWVIIALIVLLIGVAVSTHMKDDGLKSERAKKIDSQIVALAQQQQRITASAARLEFLIKELSDGEIVGAEIKAADKKWTATVNRISQQAQRIQSQQKEINKLKAQLAAKPKVEVAPEKKEKEATK